MKMSELKRRKVPGDEQTDVKRKTKSPNTTYVVKTNRLRLYFLIALIFTVLILGTGNVSSSFYLNNESCSLLCENLEKELLKNKFIKLLCFLQPSNVEGSQYYFSLFQWNSSYSHNAGVLENLKLTLGLTNYVHAVVIDAGSTGTRVLCYGFVRSPQGESLKLHKEFFKELKPGISSFANNPAESVKNLRLLVEEAKGVIPKEEWGKTSLVMKATAGLRLLPEHKAHALLSEARKFLKSSGFQVDEKSVSIVDGTEEGLLSWFTVNFLLDRLGSDPSKTVVALDLGGGSTQVSFVPTVNDSLTSSHSQYITRIAAFHKQLDVFSCSYLGLGLNEGRKRILLFNSSSTEITSECINPLVKTTWTYGGVTYEVRGPQKPHYHRSEEKGEVFLTPIVEMKNCEEIVKKVLSKFEKPPSLAGKEIYAFSFYYDRSAESGLIDYKKGGKVLLRDLVKVAKLKCGEANVDQPFMCLDLVFIMVLLRDALGIPESSEINLIKWVDGHEVSWALGAAFLNLQKDML